MKKRQESVDSELSEESEIKVKMHQGSVLSPFLPAVVANVLIEFARYCALSELLFLSYHRRLRMILRSARAARGRRSG